MVKVGNFRRQVDTNGKVGDIMKKLIAIILFFVVCVSAFSSCAVVSSLSVTVTEYMYGDKIFVQSKEITKGNGTRVYKKYLMALGEKYVVNFVGDNGFSSEEISYDAVEFDYDESVLLIQAHPDAKIGKAIIKALAVTKQTKVEVKSNGRTAIFYVEIR